jgi:FixJ family two-component response regulator
MRAERQARSELGRRYASLTPRERDVMAGIVAGLLNKQIAGELGTSEATVKEQRGHVMVKMQAGSVAELVRFASCLGITPAGGG